MTPRTPGPGKKVEESSARFDAPAAFDNPLMPNARLRQIYTAMVQARAVDRGLPRERGGKAVARYEAALVSAAVDLSEYDVVVDAVGGAATAYLRGASLASVFGGTSPAKRTKGGADCGSAASIAIDDAGGGRLWVVAGVAHALHSAALRRGLDEEARQAGLVVAYVLPKDASGAAWRSVLTYVAKYELSIVFIVLRGRGGVSAAALKCGVAAIAVDADDAVALYRVAQESIGRARAGGGAAVVECVSYEVEDGGSKGRRAKADAIAGLAKYMLHRKVCTDAWPGRVEEAFLRRMAAAKAKVRA